MSGEKYRIHSGDILRAAASLKSEDTQNAPRPRSAAARHIFSASHVFETLPYSRKMVPLQEESGMENAHITVRPPSAAVRTRPVSAGYCNGRSTIFIHPVQVDHSKVPITKPDRGNKNSKKLLAIYGNNSTSITQYANGQYYRLDASGPVKSDPNSALSSRAYDYIQNSRSRFSGASTKGYARGPLRYEHFDEFLNGLQARLQHEIGL